ncbi:MAG TPA: hypothetical protein VF092_25995 [Longimicrobium sp.]
MSAIAAQNGNRGVLPRIHVTRELTLDPPVDAPADAILAAVGNEMLRAGNDVVHVRDDCVEFYDDDPPSFLFELRGGERLPVDGGVLSLGGESPAARLQMEIWMPPRVYLEPLILTLIILVAPMLPLTKAVLLTIFLGLTGMHFWGAWQGYRARIAAAARRASAG